MSRRHARGNRQRLVGVEGFCLPHGGAIQRNVGKGCKFESELFVERNGVHYDMKLHHPPGPDAPNQYHHFVDGIVHDKPHIATGEEGLIVMELLDAISESVASARPVQIKE